MSKLELKIPPPFVALAFAIAMYVVAQFTPSIMHSQWFTTAAALCLAALGLCSSITGVLQFRRAKTTINPVALTSASTLVTTGIYRMTRNPMYLGFLLVLIGWAVWLANPFVALFLPIFMLYMYRFQITREEKALGQLFGSAYTDYTAKVRRWL